MLERHDFTVQIEVILHEMFGHIAEEVFEKSMLLQYLNLKTKSANRGSKSRGGFANLYAIYVIVEDYLAKGFDKRHDYCDYEGAQFTQLLSRQRELPFGSKLQNHALNHRLNEEFKKYFPISDIVPINRNLETGRYWINENLLKVKVGRRSVNISKAIIQIIDRYVNVKQDSFHRFIKQCESLQHLDAVAGDAPICSFVGSLLEPNVDARLFEIVSYAILKYYYSDTKIFWGYSPDELKEEELRLYKTGRTNANDGGIDFVMRPLGKFFQVTETMDFRKYFLDIDKLERYPITFVVKTTTDIQSLKESLREDALRTYIVKEVVEKYLSCVEELINIPCLLDYFSQVVSRGDAHKVLNEISLQSKIEFNIDEED